MELKIISHILIYSLRQIIRTNIGNLALDENSTQITENMPPLLLTYRTLKYDNGKTEKFQQ